MILWFCVWVCPLSWLWDRNHQSLKLISFPWHSAPSDQTFSIQLPLQLTLVLLLSGTRTFLLSCIKDTWTFLPPEHFLEASWSLAGQEILLALTTKRWGLGEHRKSFMVCLPKVAKEMTSHAQKCTFCTVYTEMQLSYWHCGGCGLLSSGKKKKKGENLLWCTAGKIWEKILSLGSLKYSFLITLFIPSVGVLDLLKAAPLSLNCTWEGLGGVGSTNASCLQARSCPCSLLWCLPPPPLQSVCLGSAISHLVLISLGAAGLAGRVPAWQPNSSISPGLSRRNALLESSALGTRPARDYCKCYPLPLSWSSWKRLWNQKLKYKYKRRKKSIPEKGRHGVQESSSHPQAYFLLLQLTLRNGLGGPQWPN